MLGGASRLKIEPTIGTVISGPVDFLSGGADIGLFVDRRHGIPCTTNVALAYSLTVRGAGSLWRH